MKVNIEQDVLLKGIASTLGVVGHRGILTHCLLEANGHGLAISATDLEVSFKGVYPAEVKEPGALTVQASYFNNLIKNLTKGPLSLVGTRRFNEAEVMGISCPDLDGGFELCGLPAEQFPPIPDEAEGLVVLEAKPLREMIKKTIFSVSGDAMHSLSGIFWERVELDEGSWLRMVSSDGHRLTLVERPLPDGELDLGEGILVPYKAMREIVRFLDGQEKVALGLGEKTLVLQAADKHLFIHLRAPKFPTYRSVIPENFDYRFAVNRRGLIKTIKRMLQLSFDRLKTPVIFKLHADSMEVTFDNPDVGRGRELILVALEFGDLSRLPLEVALNARYLLEPLQAMGGETPLLEINDHARACRIMDQGDPHYFSMVMPMRKKDDEG